MKIEDIARICHEANKTLCETQGDFSQNCFDESAEWQRTSAIKDVQFCLDNPDAPASANHESWLQEKLTDGWRYGETKNPETKEHPCMVEYDKLPNSQKIKDHLFKAICESCSPFII